MRTSAKVFLGIAGFLAGAVVIARVARRRKDGAPEHHAPAGKWSKAHRNAKKAAHMREEGGA